jgi:Predicted phosphoglycerate mutase, AP superfamily
MKQFTIVLDGIADRPQERLGGKTPMEAADTPGLDALFAAGKAGTVRTIPPGMEVGSAVANMNLLGYDPAKVYKGRAVLEAAGAGIPVNPEHLYIRANFVALEGDSFDTSRMRSYSAYEIATDKAAPLAERLNREVFRPPFHLTHVDTFRNILVVEGAAALAEELRFTAAHDMIGGAVADHTRGGQPMQPYFSLMRRAYDALKEDNHTHANGIWLWGASYAPQFQGGMQGHRAVLAETSLMRGIAAIAGLDCVTLDESRGFEAFLKEKAVSALKAVEAYDFAYIHIQKLDDLSHELDAAGKTRAIEAIDAHFIRPFFARVKEPYSAVIVSDHYTFCDSGSHGGEPAPYLLLGHGADGRGRFTEQCCRDAGRTMTAPELVALQRGKG